MKFDSMSARGAFSGRKEGRRCQSINKKDEKTVQSPSKQSGPIYTREKHRNGLFSAVFIQMFKKLDRPDDGGADGSTLSERKIKKINHSGFNLNNTGPFQPQ